MCFGRSDSDGCGGQMTIHSDIHKPKLKRRRSPATADHAEPQDPRKLSKLDSTASTLANQQPMSPDQISSTQNPWRPSSLSPKDAEHDTPHMGELQSTHIPQDYTSLSSERTLPPVSISDDTSLEHRTAFLESYNTSQESHTQNFQNFADLPFYPAIHLELLRSTKMRNNDLATCFDLISKTSQQDYQTSSRGWNPTYKMEEMQDKEMLYLLVRQAEGYIGLDKIGEQDSSRTHAGAILGFFSFKLEPEDEEDGLMRPVLYIYEVHLDDRLRGKGLGSRMIRWAESQARLVKISKMMLTVFAVNEGARRIYEREGFVKDWASPEDRVTRRKVIKADYIIMSKELE